MDEIKDFHEKGKKILITLEEMKQLEEEAKERQESPLPDIFGDGKNIMVETERARKAKEVLSKVTSVTLREIGESTKQNVVDNPEKAMQAMDSLEQGLKTLKEKDGMIQEEG